MRLLCRAASKNLLSSSTDFADHILLVSPLLVKKIYDNLPNLRIKIPGQTQSDFSVVTNNFGDAVSSALLDS
jgi:hypothetical protein